MTTLNSIHLEQDLDFGRRLEEAKAGDVGALEAVCQSCYARVSELVHRRLARDLRKGRPWLTAKFSTGDVVQDVFYQLTRDLRGFEGRTRDELVSYLATSVKNRLTDAIRFHEARQRDGRRTIGPEGQAELRDKAPGPGSNAVFVEEQARISAALDALPEIDRELLQGRLFESLSFKELAGRNGYSSLFSARRAFYAAEAKLMLALESGEDD